MTRFVLLHKREHKGIFVKKWVIYVAMTLKELDPIGLEID